MNPSTEVYIGMALVCFMAGYDVVAFIFVVLASISLSKFPEVKK